MVRHTFLRPGLWHCAMGLCSTAPVAALAPWTAGGARLASPPAWTRVAQGTGAPMSRSLPPSEPDSQAGLCRFATRCCAVGELNGVSTSIAVMLMSCTKCHPRDVSLSLNILCILSTTLLSVSVKALCLSLYLARSLVAVCASSKHGGLCWSCASNCLARQLGRWLLCHS